MLERTLVAEEIIKGAYLSNNIYCQRLVIDRNPLDNMLDHPGELVVHNQLAKTEGHSHLKHSQTVYQIGPCQYW